MINIRMHHKEVHKLSPKIIVVGVGGAGGNAVNNMIGSGLDGIEFLVCNTDAQSLGNSLCDRKMQLGVSVTSGLGAGARPEIGREAAEESLEEVMQYLDGANMAFITAGMGGGTGTGAAPVIAKAAREKGILTVGVVTKPFHFEGTYRMKMAEAGIEEMQDYVDTLIVIPNQNLFRIANEKTTFSEAFRMADGVLQAAVRGVTDLMVRPGEINLDFADIRSVMMEMGKAMMGTGEASGEDRAEHAAEAAINNPLLDDVSLKGARGVIINVTGGQDITLFEVDQACNRIRDEVDPNANIIVGSSFDSTLDGVMRVSVVATGIDAVQAKDRKGTSGARSWVAPASPLQDRKLDRSQPNAESVAPRPVEMTPVQAAAAHYQSMAPVSYQQNSMAQASQAYASRSTAAVSAARKLEEPETDMFQAGIAMVEPIGKKPEAAAAPAPVLRGVVYNESFIPPQAVEVQRAAASANYGPQFGQTDNGLAASRQQASDPSVTTTGAGFLRPPVPGAGAQKRRTTSLFDRITGRGQEDQGGEGTTDAVSSSSETGSASGGFHASGLRARTDLQQGNLAIDAPSIKVDQSIDDELDIPAFLRRQAN